MNPPSLPLRTLQRWRNKLMDRLFDPSRQPLQERFSTVYRDRRWAGGRQDVPASGVGSTLDATLELRDGVFAALTRMVPDRGCLRIVDAPCGDMTWMPQLLARLATHYDRVEYAGVDIVPELIAANRAIASPAPNVSLRFECLDLTRDPLPTGDVIFCKDLVNHLVNDDVFRVLANLERSGCRYAMITSNTGHPNTELVLKSPCASRFVDLEAPPFSLPAQVDNNGYLGMWQLPFHADEVPSAADAAVNVAALPHHLQPQIPTADYFRYLDFSAPTIIDVGVHRGTPWLYEAFAGRKFLLIDPRRKSETQARKLWPDFTFVRCAAGAQTGTATMNFAVRASLSSLLDRTLPDEIDKQERVPVRRLDDIVAELGLAGPYGLKIDVEGFELDVLKGAANILSQVEFIITEASIKRRFVNGSRFSDLVALLRQHDFELLDMLRPGALPHAWADFLFVRNSDARLDMPPRV